MEGSVRAMGSLSGSLSAMGSLSGSLSPVGQALRGALTVPEVVEREAYAGAYAVTPGPEAQTLATEGLRMTGDIVIGAIPSNYGLITWDGTKLTVS